MVKEHYILRALIAENGLTQAQLASLYGCNVRTVGNWCNGRTRIPRIIFEYLELRKAIKTLNLKAGNAPE